MHTHITMDIDEVTNNESFNRVAEFEYMDSDRVVSIFSSSSVGMADILNPDKGVSTSLRETLENGIHSYPSDGMRKKANGAGLSILAIGDPHFKIEHIVDIGVYISRIIAIVKSECPDLVVILGDLLHCHERIHTSVLNKAYEFIHKLRVCCPVYVIVGNHDYINNKQFLTDNHWMNAMKEWKNVTIVDKGCIANTPFGKLIFCPYVYPGKFIEALDIIDLDWRTSRCIFCHQEFYGCKMGALISEQGDKWQSDFPFIISGHIHDKQRVGSNIFYTGSSIQHAFGESADKNIMMCYLEMTIRVEKIDLNMPRKRILYKSMEELATYQLPIPTKDQLRITVHGTYEEFKTFRKSRKYKELTNQGIKIVYRHKPLEENLNVKRLTRMDTDVEDSKPFNFQQTLFDLIANDDRYVQNIYQDLFLPV